MKTFDRKFLFGILVGVLSLLIVIFIYDKIFIDNNTPIYLKKSKDSTLTLNNVDFTSLNNIFEEKLYSINKRIDDILIFGGIIITLLLAINISVFVKAANEVDSHFNEHFEEYRKKVEESASKVTSLLNKAEADANLISQHKEKYFQEKQSIQR
ncbi:MAG: hypothetical protein HY959_04230 [Ignavibacteriae bacterium]|nr:hypothetical protein [Ignavibacteriota bacterium]